MLKHEAQDGVYRSPIFHPLMLLGIWIAVGCLFALQEYAELRFMPTHVALRTSMTLWGLYTLISGSMFIAVWIPLRRQILTGDWRFLLKYLLPLSVVQSIIEEVLFVVVFPLFVAPTTHRTFMNRLEMVLCGDLVTNMAFFWIAVLIIRGIGYYEKFRQTEFAASELRAELVGTQLRALRMQLNPHFLFNTMNGISSLIYGDPGAADQMLEQLSRLLRMTLDRGEVQEVTLREEIDFVAIYLEIQRTRFGERLRYEIAVAPETLDALVPTMILQPLVENAYRHGIAQSLRGGLIRLSAESKNGELMVSVTNTGASAERPAKSDEDRIPIGVSNVKARLELHYQERQSFTLHRIDNDTTEALLTMPLKIAGGSYQDVQGTSA